MCVRGCVFACGDVYACVQGCACVCVSVCACGDVFVCVHACRDLCGYAFYMLPCTCLPVCSSNNLLIPVDTEATALVAFDLL